MNQIGRTTRGLDRRSAQRAGARHRPARYSVSLFGAALLASCGALVGGDATVGGETHFLLTCQDDCGPGLSCIEGVCTRGCEPGYSSCSELAAAASCESVPAPADERVQFAGTCDVRCERDADCATLGGKHDCRAGVCRAEPTGAPPVASSRAPLVHAVDPDTCESGLRWSGGDTPSAEMQPGSDCLGCHGDDSALPFMFAGTVYASAEFDAPRSLDGCFGLEGVEVVMADAEGREYRAVTNRAGNFYVEGSTSDVVLPYTADIRWTLDGEAIRTSMGTFPQYGGCGRCHGSDAEAPERFDLAPQDPAYVNPVVHVFTPGLRDDSR